MAHMTFTQLGLKILILASKWAIYCDPLIQELRDLVVGAHIGGLFMVVTMYADSTIKGSHTSASVKIQV